MSFFNLNHPILSLKSILGSKVIDPLATIWSFVVFRFLSWSYRTTSVNPTLNTSTAVEGPIDTPFINIGAFWGLRSLTVRLLSNSISTFSKASSRVVAVVSTIYPSAVISTSVTLRRNPSPSVPMIISPDMRFSISVASSLK